MKRAIEHAQSACEKASIYIKGQSLAIKDKPVCSHFPTIHYMSAYKTIHMYYLKNSHNLLNKPCD